MFCFKMLAYKQASKDPSKNWTKFLEDLSKMRESANTMRKVVSSESKYWLNIILKFVERKHLKWSHLRSGANNRRFGGWKLKWSSGYISSARRNLFAGNQGYQGRTYKEGRRAEGDTRPDAIVVFKKFIKTYNSRQKFFDFLKMLMKILPFFKKFENSLELFARIWPS